MEPDQSVLAFHFYAVISSALPGWLPAHALASGAGSPPAQPEMETRDRVDPENTGVKPTAKSHPRWRLAKSADRCFIAVVVLLVVYAKGRLGRCLTVIRDYNRTALKRCGTGDR